MAKTPVRDTFFDPLGWGTFEEEYLGKKFYHFACGEDEVPATLFSWEVLNTLLAQEGIWSGGTLKLAQNGALLAVEKYCRQGLDREGQGKWIPDLDRVLDWWQQGAGLVCNDVATLTPALREMATFLGEVFQARVLANIYATSQDVPAFAPHFDTHDVWAFQVSGTKTWRLYGQEDAPINHPIFNDLDKAYHHAHKGALQGEITTSPGDVLYIPRGLYHDAYATDHASLHVTFSVTRPTGLDAMSALFERLIHVPLARQDVPLSVRARTQYLQQLSQEIDAILRQENPLHALVPAQKERVSRVLPLPVSPVMRVEKGHVSLRHEQNTLWLVTPRAQVSVPQEWQSILPWIMTKSTFSQEEFHHAHPSISKASFQRLMNDLLNMSVLEHAPNARES
ncbi:MAG: cupin domain-containing protein [Proteobacteria bacterium]|nr:cupin domain-containing protein [Pseudomonadota bacterium]